MKIIKYLRMRKYKKWLIKERIKRYPHRALGELINVNKRVEIDYSEPRG